MVSAMDMENGSATVLFQVFFRFESRHAAAASSGNGLSVPTILHVAACEDAGHAGEDVIMRTDVSVVVEFNLTGEHFRVGHVSNPEEHGADRKNRTLPA